MKKQIVIDTNKCPFRTDNSECKCTNEDCFIDDVSDICPLVRHGTVLPKHGRLIDAEDLSLGLVELWHTADADAETVIKDVVADVVIPIVVGMPTILEASQQM